MERLFNWQKKRWRVRSKSNESVSSISTVVASIILDLKSQIQTTVLELGSYANRRPVASTISHLTSFWKYKGSQFLDPWCNLCLHIILGAETGTKSMSQRSSGKLFQHLAVSVNTLFFSQAVNSESTNNHGQKQRLFRDGKTTPACKGVS